MTDGRLPVLRPQELERALLRMGFVLLRKSPGSHRQYKHPDGRRTTIPFHKGTTIGRGLLRRILRDVKATAEEISSFI
jgi:predicted RNA binding protein YcfA (HicA-like mRNA interferase family)